MLGEPMIDPIDRSRDEPADPVHLRLLSRGVQAGLAVVALLSLAAVARDPDDVVALLLLAASLGLIAAYAAEYLVRRRLIARREVSGAELARTLQQISRSTSSEAIVDTVLDELRRRADADHILVARLRPVERVVEATLVSTRARVPPSRTSLPARVLDPAKLKVVADDTAPAQRVADEIARRLGGSYALPNTLAAPLVAKERILGALILSRRQAREWTAADHALLDWSTTELSAALARAFAFEEVENRANVDALTGLPNRRYLEELLATVGPRRRSVDRLGVLMIDLDHFKRLNDRYGHATGDAVLRAVAERLSTAVRAEDTPARYGGEEFVVVLRRASNEQAVDVAERIRAQVEAIPHAELGVREPITVSIGVAVGDVRAAEVRALLDAADTALYRAKSQGRNRVAVAPATG
jgi:diguanylate cyclase (GGDEF)-like protein